MSGVVGVAANDSGRYTFFAAALTALQTPVNTAVMWAIGSDRIVGRNRLVQQSLEIGSEWLWFLDDDHVFPPDLLLRLLAHDQPVVAALYLQRQVPFAPVAYSHREGDKYVPLVLPDLEPDACVEVRAAGTGGMLIRSEVFRAVSEPWFEHGAASEDLIFCEKARAAGFTIHCDLAARLGHLTSTIVWPTIVDERWAVGFTVADKLGLHVEIEKPREPT